MLCANDTIFEKSFELKPNLTIKIKKISDIYSINKKYHCIPILNSAFSKLGNLDRDYLFLPKLYAALTRLTGPGDSWFDDYKGSYSFTFELEVEKNHNTSRYIYHISHFRSYIDFTVYQITSREDQRDPRVLHDPNDDLFSDDDICIFSRFFCAYSLGYIEGLNYTPESFVKSSESNLLLFGFSENKYFFEKFKNPEEFNDRKHFLEHDVTVVCETTNSD